MSVIKYFIIGWRRLFNIPAKGVFECQNCYSLCDRATHIGMKKEHIYIEAHCPNCGKLNYISVDNLKHKPEFDDCYIGVDYANEKDNTIFYDNKSGEMYTR